MENKGETAYQPQVIVDFHTDLAVDNVRLRGDGGDGLKWEVNVLNDTQHTKQLVIHLPRTLHTNDQRFLSVRLSIGKFSSVTFRSTLLISAL